MKKSSYCWGVFWQDSDLLAEIGGVSIRPQKKNLFVNYQVIFDAYIIIRNVLTAVNVNAYEFTDLRLFLSF